MGLASVVVVVGCGGKGPTITNASTVTKASILTEAPAVTHRKSTSLARTEAVYNAIASHALVTMRQLSPESLMWQSVAVRADGTALLTTLIGELSGAPRRTFRLPARRAALLRQLVAGARTAPLPSSINPRDEDYTLHIRGGPAMTIEGPIPGRLAALVHFLSGLMFTYCC